ncbi:GntR family transcriptional regulator [Amycolatopsis keratiniphila]|uniref:GntR family transcriptional regulator n=1 Tax=Amycolatopsis keratiniphila TaxID=129921 RepID=UPI0009F9EB6C|nr:GntR family transcriptional regulator [Amycolatopsis keratiniphila]
MTTPDPTKVAADLRQRILSREFEPGHVLPREDDLASQLGVNRSTVRRAYRLLREQHLVEPRKNRGTVVLDPTGRDRLTRSAIERDARGYYLQSGGRRHQLLHHYGVQLGEAPPDVAHLLNIEPGAEVVIRDRTLGQPRNLAEGRNHDQPMILSTTYLPGWVAEEVPAVKKADPGPGGIYDRIEETLGGPLAWHMIVTAELATAETSKRLSIARTSAVLRQQRVTSLPDGRPVEVLDQRVSGDKFEIDHPIPRADSAAWPRTDGS